MSASTPTSKIAPHLWFADKAVEAANFYVSLFPNSRVDSVTPIPADTPSGPAGSVQVVEFTLAGQQFMAINAGPLDLFNHAISFLVNCTDQAEVDRLWDALSAGGTIEQCLAQGPLRRLLADRAGRARGDDEGPRPRPRPASDGGDARHEEARHRRPAARVRRGLSAAG